MAETSRKRTPSFVRPSSLLLSLFALFMPACSLLPQYRDPESIAIGGETYMSGFYRNLWVEGIRFAEGEDPDFETEYHDWWKVEGGPFDLYCAQHKEKLWWNPAVYCKEDEFETAMAYYADSRHFDYWIGIYGDSNKESRVRLEEQEERPLLEEAVSLNMRVEASGGAGIFGWQEDFADVEVHIPEEEILQVKPVLYRVSKDGFFTTIQNSWIVTGSGIYVKGIYDGESEQTYTAYRLSEEANEYIMGLLNKHGILIANPLR